MAAASQFDTSVPALTATWAAGLISLAADTEKIFSVLPVLGFAVLGVIGGFVGWCLLIETGKTDALTSLQSIGVLLRRCAMGIGVGIAVWLVWLAFGGGDKGEWMLVTGAFAVAPVEMAQWAIEKAKGIVK